MIQMASVHAASLASRVLSCNHRVEATLVLLFPHDVRAKSRNSACGGPVCQPASRDMRRTHVVITGCILDI